MSNEGKHVVRVASMITGGAVLGAGIALLFAPQTGLKTRRDINRYAEKTQLRTIRWGRSLQSRVKSVTDWSRGLVQHRDRKLVDVV